jgi:chaperonin cofactor prefoldin
MSDKRYLRDRRTGAVVLADTEAIEAFRQKKTVTEDIECLKTEINTLKQQVAQLQESLKTLQASE